MKNDMLKKKGFTLVEIMIVVAIIGLVLAIAVPNFVRSRTLAKTSACISNLRQLRGAAQVYALDTGVLYSTSVGSADLLSDYVKTWPTCGGTAYGSFRIDTDPVCPNATADHTL